PSVLRPPRQNSERENDKALVNLCVKLADALNAKKKINKKKSAALGHVTVKRSRRSLCCISSKWCQLDLCNSRIPYISWQPKKQTGINECADQRLAVLRNGSYIAFH